METQDDTQLQKECTNVGFMFRLRLICIRDVLYQMNSLPTYLSIDSARSKEPGSLVRTLGAAYVLRNDLARYLTSEAIRHSTSSIENSNSL